MTLEEAVDRARKFLGGEELKFAEGDALWKQLKREDQLALARTVLQQIREKPNCLSDGVPNDQTIQDVLWQQEALLTSKDPELSAATRHDAGLKLLAKRFNFIENDSLPGDSETLGIAGGIRKRRWNDLGQLQDLRAAAAFYERGAKNAYGDDAYPHINAAFLEDVLAAAGDRTEERQQRARELRQRIIKELPLRPTWWNAATRAEALFGLGLYEQATEVLKQAESGTKPAPWELRTMAEQLADLAHLHESQALNRPDVQKDIHKRIHNFFETLLPGSADAIRAVMIGKVGLALSGGGFRASYYHLGVMACLAERDVLRDVEVLSCVSGEASSAHATG
jgi:tetratricopeptide (TPR) repeat protein